MPKPFFGESDGERILLQLFRQSFHDPETQVIGFLNQLRGVRLPFHDLLSQIRRLEYPVYPPFDYAPPPAYYYFVDGSGWGSDRPLYPDPLNNNFVYHADGFSLNLGCPLRLRRAVKRLATLPDPIKSEIERDLALPRKHLSIVEELLWLDMWQGPFQISRSPDRSVPNEDWIVETTTGVFRQECKWRPSDWARLLDGDDFVPLSFLSKPAEQLPNPPMPNQINVAAITGMKGITARFRNIIAQELAAFPNVQVLVYRTYDGATSLFSLVDENLQKVLAAMAPQAALSFQPIYHVFGNRSEAERRRLARLSNLSPPAYFPPTPRLFSGAPIIVPSPTVLSVPPPYRVNVVNRLASGEPEFEVVPQNLPA